MGLQHRPWTQAEVLIFMAFSSLRHKSLTQKFSFVVDDLWNDNRGQERLLKAEVGAPSVALGTGDFSVRVKTRL